MAKTEVRKSGKTAGEEVTAEESERLTEPPEDEVLPEEREVKFRTPGFQRMRTSWRSEDRPVIKKAKDAVEGAVLNEFKDAYQVLHEVYAVVRTPQHDPETGEIVTDRWGWPIWERNASGDYEEDWSRLTRKEREDLLFTITTRLFAWEQRSADIWGEAMFAKAQWEERYSSGYDEPSGSLTIDDRKAKGNLYSTDERYFALYMSMFSKKADAIVRTLTLLGQRLKDSLEWES